MFVVARALQRGLELAKMEAPEVGQELLYGGEAAGVDQEQVTRASAVLVDEASIMQHLQVAGYSLGGDVKVRGNVTDRARLARDELQDGAAVRLGERLERGVRIQGCRPIKATSLSVSEASAATAIAGPIRGLRKSGVIACSANASTCPVSASSRLAR